MNPAADPEGARTSANPRRVIDQVCNRFEEAWRSGQRPRLEEFLAALPEADQPALLRELLPIELDYRRAREEDCRPEEYRIRFPGLEAAWLAELLTEETPQAPGGAPRYRVLRFHARGGLGEVHVAIDTELGREVALKRMQERHHGDPEGYRRFLREAELTARLEHPGVVPVHGLIHDQEGRPCYAMRFIEGESLKDALRRLHGPEPATTAGLTLRQLLTRLVTVCQTVAYAHSRGILHRDLKPANIMLGRYGETLVVDWGLARARTDPEPEAGNDPPSREKDRPPAEATGTGQTLGTPGYMSPEQAAGRTNELGPAGDIFSLGATLYAVLTGRAPYPETPGGGLLPLPGPASFTPPCQVKPDIPLALEAICLKALAWRPEDRYASALDLAADLERWLADEPVSAYPEPWTQRLGRWLKRRRTLVTGVAALILGAVPILATLVVLLERERASTEQERRTAQDNADRAVLAMNQARQAVFEMGRQAQAGVLSSKRIRQQNLRVARQTFSRFLQQYPDDPGLLSEVAEFHFHFGWVCMEIGDWQEAIQAYQEALDHYARMQSEGQTPKITSRQATCWVELGLAYHAVGRPARAEGAFRQALELQEPLLEKSTHLTHRTNLAEMYADLGVFLRDTGRRAEAEVALQTARTRWESTLTQAQESKASSHFLTCRVGLVLTLARLQEFEQAQVHLPELARLLVDARREDVLYDAVRAYALLAGDRRPGVPADTYAGQAMVLLRRAITRDFINLHRLQSDPDLAALRQREEFQEVVRALAERARTGFL